MGKLHELLAVEGDLKSAAISALAKAKEVFSSARVLGMIRHYTPLMEDGSPLADERTELSTTSRAELAIIAEKVGAWMDAAIQKEITNAETAADVQINGKTLIPSLPAPALLNLESKLVEIRKLYSALPINDAAERWTRDESIGCWVSAVRTTYRAEKRYKSFEASPATEHHPAQVTVYTEDEKVGVWETTIYSGAVAVTEKQAYLDRIDILARAVRQARQRANMIDVKNVHVAGPIFAFINGE